MPNEISEMQVNSSQPNWCAAANNVFFGIGEMHHGKTRLSWLKWDQFVLIAAVKLNRNRLSAHLPGGTDPRTERLIKKFSKTQTTDAELPVKDRNHFLKVSVIENVVGWFCVQYELRGFMGFQSPARGRAPSTPIASEGFQPLGFQTRDRASPSHGNF